MECLNCGNKVQITYKDPKAGEELICEKCNEKMKVSEVKDLVDDFVEMAEELGSDVEIISTETEEGMQLFKAFGGIGAILRYRT